jgi:hypothetical protein
MHITLRVPAQKAPQDVTMKLRLPSTVLKSEIGQVEQTTKQPGSLYYIERKQFYFLEVLSDFHVQENFPNK